MRVAVIGTGIAGNVAAYRLRDAHDVTVFEADERVGGHTHTIDVEDGTRTIPVDTGFIVFNNRTYPRFLALLDELGQESKPTDMSFSVQAAGGALEYKGSGFNALFAQRSNLLNPGFLRMLRDVLRFNREAPADAIDGVASSLGDYLEMRDYSDEFRDHYLVPMAAAIWSAEPGSVTAMPFRFLVRFFANHGLLQLHDRPEWRVICGGSRQYAERLVSGHRDRIRLRSPVRRLHREPGGIALSTDAAGTEHFDAVFVACHTDQALAMLQQPSIVESQVLGAIAYQRNEAVLHTDPVVLPTRRRAWAAWNYHLPERPGRHVAVTYNMNLLQGFSSRTQFCVTLNNSAGIDPDRVLQRIEYAHPVFNDAAVAAQARHRELNGAGIYYCGAWLGNGFHEDGVVSAETAVRHFTEDLQHAQLHLRRAG